VTQPITPDKVRGGEVLLSLEGNTYYLVPVVYRLRDNELTFYCVQRDWPATDAGRVAGFVREIARLRARVEELEAEQEVVDLPSFEVVDDLPDLETLATNGTICPKCGRLFKDGRGLSAHLRRAAIHADDRE